MLDSDRGAAGQALKKFPVRISSGLTAAGNGEIRDKSWAEWRQGVVVCEKCYLHILYQRQRGRLVYEREGV